MQLNKIVIRYKRTPTTTMRGLLAKWLPVVLVPSLILSAYLYLSLTYFYGKMGIANRRNLRRGYAAADWIRDVLANTSTRMFEDREPACMKDVYHAQDQDYHGLCAVTSFLEYLKKPPDMRRKNLPIHLIKGCSTIFFNRIPKTGSGVINDVMVTLGERYDFPVRKNAKGLGTDASNPASKVKEFVRYIDDYKGPLVISKHLYFIDFVRQPKKPMVMINVMRDPMDQLVSVYNWRAKHQSKNEEGAAMTLDECIEQHGVDSECFHWKLTQMPFFCGREDGNCWRQDEHTEANMKEAKRQVEGTYMLVGVSDDLPSFFEVLEVLLPHFFCNATEVIMEPRFENPVRDLRGNVSDYSLTVIRKHLQYHIELYQFVRQRFYTILQRVRLHEKYLRKYVQVNQYPHLSMGMVRR